jgi:hypothetical protein
MEDLQEKLEKLADDAIDFLELANPPMTLLVIADVVADGSISPLRDVCSSIGNVLAPVNTALGTVNSIGLTLKSIVNTLVDVVDIANVFNRLVPTNIISELSNIFGVLDE